MPLGYEGAWLMPERSCADVPAGVKSLSHKRRGLLAQLVEQLTLNQLVAGSNPSQPTILFKDLRSLSNFHQIRL